MNLKKIIKTISKTEFIREPSNEERGVTEKIMKQFPKMRWRTETARSYFLNYRFEPDLQEKNVLIEVKLVKSSSAISQAIGQALIYKFRKHQRNVIILLYDRKGRIKDYSKEKKFLQKFHIHLVVLKKPKTY